jgi:hypothetical protein
MSWLIFKKNILESMIAGRFADDTEGFADFYANEYDQCIKRGGDNIYGVPVVNGNVKGMSDVIKNAMKKGQESDGDNFNILEEIYPAAFDAYWLGSEMAPIPNPILKPLGWASTLPAPGTIQNIGPNPTSLTISAAKNKAEVEALKILEEELKKQSVTIPGIPPIPPITIPLYETAIKIINKEVVAPDIKNNPIVKSAIEIIKKLKEARKKKPAIGSQIKKAIKFPFPKLPSKKKLIEETKEKLIEQAIEEIKKQIIPPIEEIILQPFVVPIVNAIELAKNTIPKPLPTKEEVIKYVKDTAEGLVPVIDLSLYVSIPKIPNIKEIKKQIEEQIPTEEELRDLALQLILDRLPNIPNIWFTLPTYLFSYPTNTFADPFVNLAKFHLMGTSGNMVVFAQYPPPAPPAPAILNWAGYKVIG